MFGWPLLQLLVQGGIRSCRRVHRHRHLPGSTLPTPGGLLAQRGTSGGAIYPKRVRSKNPKAGSSFLYLLLSEYFLTSAEK